MNPYNFAMMVFSIGSFFLAILVYLKRQDSIGRAYFIFNVFVSIWSSFHAIEISQNVTYETALLCGRLGQAAAVFIIPTWLHLTLVVNESVGRHKKILFASYLISFFIVLFAFTPWFIPKVAPTHEFLYYHRRGPIYDIFTVTYFIFVPFGFLQLLSKIRRSSKEEAVPIKGFFVATGIGFFIASFTFLPIYDILFPQYNLLLMPLYPLIFSYFMIRHRLFDIEQIAQAFQREKLATIGLLAASVNHEIRNPLYIAKSALESYIENEQEGLGKQKPLEISKKSLAAVNRALDVIAKLNRFAKPTVDSNPQNQKASIPEAVQTVLDLIACEFELEKVHIENQIEPNIPTVQADQRQLEEILFNLIVNACHAMSASSKHPDGSASGGSGGELIVSARNDDCIQILIKDSGTGIPPEQAKHLFEPFHTTKGDKGTGLGLYITKQLVERNGGKISVKTKEGEGTSFILEFKKSTS